MHLHRAITSALCLALLAAPALAKKSAAKADGSKGSKNASTGGATAGLVDHHLGCDLSAKGITLEPWTSAGVGDVSPSVKAKFKSLGTIRDAADFARFRKLCPKLPDKVSRFVSGPWLGTMSSASLIVATEDVQVHRAYSTPANGTCGTKSQSGEFGSWWSVMPLPAASGREEYRRKMAVCSSWNDFKMKVTCTLKKGSVIAVGPTQSMDCTADNHAKEQVPGCAATVKGWKDKHPANGNHQVFINLFGRDAERGAFLTGCTSGAW